MYTIWPSRRRPLSPAEVRQLRRAEANRAADEIEKMLGPVAEAPPIHETPPPEVSVEELRRLERRYLGLPEAGEAVAKEYWRPKKALAPLEGED